MSELTRRYVVMTLASTAPFDVEDREGVFVLKPWKDPAALRALTAYRDNCYPELARDLDAWIRAIQGAPSVRGDVGRRNEPHVRPTDGHGGKRAARPRATGPKSRGPASRGSRTARTAHPPRKPASGHPRQPKRRRRRS
jgi:hypothetical protein